MSKRHPGGRSAHLPNEVVELAVIFVAAGAVHLLTTVAGHATYGPALLMAIGTVVVIGLMTARHVRSRRRGHAAQEPAWPVGTPVCVECGAAQETVLVRLDQGPRDQGPRDQGPRDQGPRDR